MKRADVFVLLAHAQFSPGNYHNRFTHAGKWHTMSVNRGLEPLANKKYLSHKKDWARIRTNLYSYDDVLGHFDDCIVEDLVGTNFRVLTKMLEMLGIEDRVTFDYPTELTKAERLVDLCKYYDATEYLSGPSGRKYLTPEDLALFEREGIKVTFQEPTRGRSALELLKEKMS